MEKLIAIETAIGTIEGRDAIFIDSIDYSSVTTLILTGSFNQGHQPDLPFKIIFNKVVYLKSVELDFDDRNQGPSFGIVEQSTLLKSFHELNHSGKINTNHQHFYFRTYDTVFEVVADGYELGL